MAQTPIIYERGRTRFDSIVAKEGKFGTLIADAIYGDSELVSGSQTIDGKLTVASGIVSPMIISGDLVGHILGNVSGDTYGTHYGTQNGPVSGLVSGLAGIGLVAGASSLSFDNSIVSGMAGAGLAGASGKIAISMVLVRDVVASLESGEIGAFAIDFPYPAVVKVINGVVVKATPNNGSGTITFTNSSGSVSMGVMSAPASASVGGAVVAIASPAGVNVASGGTITITTAVMSSGGRVLVSIEHTKTG